MNYQGLDWLKS